MELEQALDEFIIDHFREHSGKLVAVLRLLPLTAKIDMFEYIAHTPLVENPVVEERFAGVRAGQKTACGN